MLSDEIQDERRLAPDLAQAGIDDRKAPPRCLELGRVVGTLLANHRRQVSLATLFPPCAKLVPDLEQPLLRGS